MFIHTRCIVCVWRRCACAEGPRSSPLCLLTSGELDSTSCLAALFACRLRARQTCFASTLTLFRAIVLSRISAKFSAVILKNFSSSAQYYCEVLCSGALIRQRLYRRFFTTSKITHSPLCQKVIRFLLFSSDIVCNTAFADWCFKGRLQSIILYRECSNIVYQWTRRYCISMHIDVFQCKCVHCSYSRRLYKQPKYIVFVYLSHTLLIIAKCQSGQGLESEYRHGHYSDTTRFHHK